MGSSRPAGLSYVADRFTLQDSFPWLQPASEVPQVSIIGAVSPVVSKYDQIAVPALSPRKPDYPVARGLDLGSGGRPVVDALVRTPLLEDRMATQAEPRRDARKL